MTKVDGPVGQTTGAGKLDVIRAQHFQHFSTHQTHDQGELEMASVMAGKVMWCQPLAVISPELHQPICTT